MPDGLRTPEGYRKVEAYTNGREVVVCEWPEDDDEMHNCDALGCSSFSHVKYRVEIPDWQAAQKQPEPKGDRAGLECWLNNGGVHA